MLSQGMETALGLLLLIAWRQNQAAEKGNRSKVDPRDLTTLRRKCLEFRDSQVLDLAGHRVTNQKGALSESVCRSVPAVCGWLLIGKK